MAIARSFAPRYPTNSLLEKTIAWESYQNRDFDSASVAIEKALRLAGNSQDRASVLNIRAQILLASDVPKFLESLIEGFQTRENTSVLTQYLDAGHVAYNAELLEISFDRMKASFEVRRAKLEHRPYGDIASVMAKHLREMTEMARNSQAEVVFLTYPLAGDGNMNDVLRRVASEKQAGLVDLEAAFTQRLKSTPKADLFTADGHLSNTRLRSDGRSGGSRYPAQESVNGRNVPPHWLINSRHAGCRPRRDKSS